MNNNSHERHILSTLPEKAEMNGKYYLFKLQLWLLAKNARFLAFAKNSGEKVLRQLKLSKHLNLCRHATIAVFSLLANQGKIKVSNYA